MAWLAMGGAERPLRTHLRKRLGGGGLWEPEAPSNVLLRVLDNTCYVNLALTGLTPGASAHVPLRLLARMRSTAPWLQQRSMLPRLRSSPMGFREIR